ncbi:MAG: class B sortase [Oscillospiraceae bacterium]|jgi:sortase B|nr:class B sortase [Oscillospiraceae bacterium]
MAAIAYNTRPRPAGIYIDGKKRNALTRFIIRMLPWKGDSKLEMGRKSVFLVALTALIYFGGKEAFIFLNDHYQQYKIDQKLSGFWNPNISDELFEEVNRNRQLPMLPEYIEHYLFNSDLVGHILIPDITRTELTYSDHNRHILNYLVYQTDNNSFYLDHNFDGSRSAGGSIYADFRNRFTDDGILSGNTVLYGHNIYTGNMFAKVADYYKAYSHRRDMSFYHRHPIVHFNTLYERHDWKIFAVGLFNTKEEYGDVFPYHIIRDFETADDFHDFVFNVMDRSVLFTDVDLMYGDHILTLSTCYWPFGEHVDTRTVVFARRVRDGESSFVDVEKAQWNDNFLPFTHQMRVTGNTWVGRVWDYETYLLSYGD